MSTKAFVNIWSLSKRDKLNSDNHDVDAVARGFFNTRMTESPRRNIFEMNLSLFTGLAFFLPFPVFGSSVHISLTPSRTMLQCLSNAFTLPRSFLLFLQLISTWVFPLTDSVRTERGPVLNSCCSLASSSSGVISDLGFVSADDEAMMDEDRSNEVKTLESDFARVPM